MCILHVVVHGEHVTAFRLRLVYNTRRPHSTWDVNIYRYRVLASVALGSQVQYLIGFCLSAILLFRANVNPP